MENPFRDIADQLMSALKSKVKVGAAEANAPLVLDEEAYLAAGAVLDQPAVSEIDAVLAQRGKRYGTFKSNSIVYDDLIKVFEASPNWHSAPPEVRHACHNIATKLSRLLTGEVMYDDNWTDIAGYATLMAKICRGEAS